MGSHNLYVSHIIIRMTKYKEPEIDGKGMALGDNNKCVEDLYLKTSREGLIGVTLNIDEWIALHGGLGRTYKVYFPTTQS
jgi:hypothetical protein